MLMLMALAAAQPAVPATPAVPCRPMVKMARDQAAPRLRTLAEMPPATQVLGVYREVGGCHELAVVRREVGAPGRP